MNDEVIVAASERASIRTSFNVGENEVLELMPGNALIVDNNGEYKIEQVLAPKEEPAVLNASILAGEAMRKFYRERIALGEHLSKAVLESVDYSLKIPFFLTSRIRPKWLLWAC